jgi:transcriptional regulator with XRE-family HTH domain
MYGKKMGNFSVNIINFEKRLLSIRKQKNLNQTEFSDFLGLAQNHVNQVERGKRNPSVNFIMSILKATKVNANWLLTGRGPMYLPIEQEKEEIKEINEDRAAYGADKTANLDIGLDSLKSHWDKLSDEQKKVLMGAIKEMVKNNKETRKLKDFIIEMVTKQPGEIPSNVVQRLTD